MNLLSGRSFLLSVAILVIVAWALASETNPDPGRLRAASSITARELQALVEFLSDPQMRGRGISSEANHFVARYLAHRFELIGLRPVPQLQSHLHPFQLSRTRLSGHQQLGFYFQNGTFEEARLGQDFYPSPFSASSQARQSLIFAGYGITAPEYGYDDYQGLSPQGKVVMVLQHEPGEDDPQSPFEGLVLSEYGQEYSKILNAQQRGAKALLVVDDLLHHHGQGSFKRLGQIWWPGQDEFSGPYLLDSWLERIDIPVLHLSPALANRLLEPASLDLESLQQRWEEGFRPAFPEVEVEVAVELERQHIKLHNVLGVLPGSDPSRRHEVVLISAHFDHLGTRGGELFPGADDNASGTAGLLEVAEAFAQAPAPQRTILFAAWNAEEHGLLGSFAYVSNPLYPLQDTVAVFQMDMIGRNEEVSDPTHYRFRGLPLQTADSNLNAVNVLGATHSEDLKKLVESVNQEVGLEVRFRYDNHVINLLRRSDNWPFLTRQVPALLFTTGLHPDYHRPGDTPDKLNYPKMEKIARLVFLAAWQAARSPAKPRFQRKAPP